MRLKHLFLSLLLLFLASGSMFLYADGFYKWRDAYGNIQYGDNPPKNARLERLDLPQLTVIQDYGSQWQSKEIDAYKAPVTPPIKRAIRQAASFHYEKFNFIAPKRDQLIHAKDGDISAMLSIRPPLKAGHKIVFVLDGKSSAAGTLRISNFSALAGGKHSLSAHILNAQGEKIKDTETINFRVIRFDTAQSKKHKR